MSDGDIRCGSFNPRIQALLEAERARRVPAYVAFGEALREERLLRDLRLRQAAERAGLAPADYSAIETGRAAPPEELERFLMALGIERGGASWGMLCELAREAWAAAEEDER